MEQHYIIKKSIEHKIAIIKLILACVIAMYIFFEGWALFATTDLYYTLHQKYVLFTFKIIQSIADVLGYKIVFLAENNFVQYLDKTLELKLPFRSYSIFFVGFIFLFTIPLRKWMYIVNTILFVLLFISFRAASKTIIELIYIESVHKVLLIWIETSVNIVLFIIVYSLINHNVFINKIYGNFKEKFSEHLNINILNLIILLIIIHSIPRILLTYFADWFITSLVGFTLSFSKLFLLIIGYTTSISGKFIYLQNNWISLERTCLGIGVLTIIITIIFATKTKLFNKFLYAILFSFLYLIANSIRLAGLLIYLNKFYDSGEAELGKLHNNVSIILYLVAFFGLFIYIMWFGNLNLEMPLKKGLSHFKFKSRKATNHN
jgi:exosortase/archaeosortase family protein